MLDDTHQALFNDVCEKEVMDKEAKLFYEMMDSAKKPLHDHTMVSQLDGIGRLLGLKSELNRSRAGFDKLLTVVGTLLPKGHCLPTGMYESQKLFRALKMPYEQIHACPNGCVLFRKEHADAKYCLKCKSSRYEEVPTGDGQLKQLDIAQKILRYLPFVPRTQRLYMTEESAKQMTWHKKGKRYSPDKMIHPSDAEAWQYFDGKHPEKADEAHNVRVALATDGFNPYGMSTAAYTCWPMFIVPLNLPPVSPFNGTPYSCH
jgi:hypothetical protein